MNIVFIANFPANLDGGKAKGRFLYLGEMLCERGHHVEMIVSDFDHGPKQHRAEGSVKQEAYKTKITTLHEPGYPNNISLKRLWSHYVWGRNVEKYLKSILKPDVIYSAIPSLTANVRAAQFCKKNGIKYIIDVQDLWPEAFVLAIKNKLLQQAFKPIAWYINRAYRAADVVVAVSETYMNRALEVNRKNAKGVSVFLGNDGALFDEARDSMKVEKTDGILQLCYIGTLGYSYDLKCAVDAVAIYNQQKDLPPMQFLVMGGGPLKEEFENYAKEKKIDTIFTGSLPYPEMVARMCSSDILINPIVKGAAQSITNKVGDYALAGLPVVSTQENKEYRQLVDSYMCGINCRVGNAQDVADALVKLARDPELRKQMGVSARRFGKEKFDRRETYQEIVKVVEDIKLDS